MALVWGVEKIGGGKWAEIKKLDCVETACLQRRTAVDLKDKVNTCPALGHLCPFPLELQDIVYLYT